jgi:transposase InsO family protein
MANKHHKPIEIVAKLRQVEVLVGQGMARLDAIREVSVTEQTYYRWRRKYGGMGSEQLRELKRLQRENGYCESFNAPLRDELLNGEIFYTLKEAQVVIEGWRQHDNTARPHSALGYKPPAPEAIISIDGRPLMH